MSICLKKKWGWINNSVYSVNRIEWEEMEAKFNSEQNVITDEYVNKIILDIKNNKLFCLLYNLT